MKFDRVAGSISKNVQLSTRKKFEGLSLELGVREDNQHVGTGMGGNGAQLFALMSFSHELIDDISMTIEIDQGRMRWGCAWLDTASRATIRQVLDTKLPIPKHTSLDDIRKDTRFSLGPNTSNWDVLLYASNMCEMLARDLDAGDESKVKSTAFALAGFPMEVCLVAVRKHIQIERLVRHNLDEHPDFGKV